MSAARRLPEVLEELVARVLADAGLELPERGDVESELRAHFEDGIEAGVEPEELVRRFGDPVTAGRRIARARARARRAHGGDGGGRMGATEMGREIRHALRRLARAPAFTLVVVLTLALGVGANTAIFTVLDAVVLRPLPYPSPDRLVRVYEAAPDDPGNVNYLRGPTSAAYRTWAEVFDRFAAIYTYSQQGADLTLGDRPMRITIVPVTAGYFETLGVPPLLGRTFVEAESFPPGGEPPEGAVAGSGAPVAILSNELWEELFGADPAALGATVHLNDVGYEIVGVMPPGFDNPFGPSADAWIPQNLATDAAGRANGWGNYYLSGVGRLPEGLSLAAAQERSSALYARLKAANADAGDWGPRLEPLHADLVGPTRRTMLWILTGAAVLVLLTACLNVANLIFARGLGRDRDVALRSALGSGRSRILLGVLAENAVLAVVGGAAGLTLGWAGVRALLALAPEALPRATQPELGAAVFLFALGTTVLALLGFGLAPALRMSRTAPADVLRSGDRAATVGRKARRVRNALVVTQVAAALVLVTGATLLARSFSALIAIDVGVDPEDVLTFEVHLPQARYPDGDDRHRFHEELEERVASLPGVEATGAVSWLPMSGPYHNWGIRWLRDDAADGTRTSWSGTNVRVFSGAYLDAVGLSVVRGTSPSEVDLDGEPFLWISETGLDLFGDVEPVGQRVSVGGGTWRVMGIVEDAPLDARGRLVRTVYLPHAQFASDRNWSLVQTVKAQRDPGPLREEIRRQIASMDGDLVLYRPRLLSDIVGSSRAQDRFATVLMGAFALLALTLSLVGTYGVLAGSVASRRREIGIRMALGADGASVRGMVLRYGAALTLPGILIGLAGAFMGARLLDTLLFGVASRDAAPYALATGIFLLVGLLSAWLPAQRATRVETVRVLGAE